MRLSQFGAYYLPLTKIETLVPSVSYEDAYEHADELDGGMPEMGLDPMPVSEATIEAVFMISRSFLSAPVPGGPTHYADDEGGLDSALYDFAVNVFDGGVRSLIFEPSPGTTPRPGLGAATSITSWTCDAQAAKQRSTVRHAGGARVYAEITMSFLISSTLWTVTLSDSSTTTIPLI